MLGPCAIELTRWRAFEHTQRIELRPLTLFFGWNNSGKSGLLRALPILADSASPLTNAPLNLKGPSARGASFRDVAWRGAPRGLGVAIEWAGAQAGRYEAELMLDDDRPEQPVMRVTRFAWRPEQGEPVEARWNFGEVSTAGAVFDFTSPTTQSRPVRFRCLSPAVGDDSLSLALAPAIRGIESLDRAVQWIGSVRRIPLEPVRVQEAPPWEIADDGSDVFDVLAHAPTVREGVNAWFEPHTGRVLELADRGGRFVEPQLLHTPSAHAQRIADHGEGLLQVLPVLAAIERARATHQSASPAPRIVAVEDPESHLHPHLQRALAQYLTEVACDDDPPTLVIETHAQLVLQAIQLAIVGDGRGPRLDPQRVALYWVDQDREGVSNARRIEIDAQGAMRGFPPDVYADVIELSRAYTRKRWNLGDEVSAGE